MGAERINKYYSAFINRNVENLVISIAPVKNDIPELRSAGLDPRDNSINIDFVVENEDTIPAFGDDLIEIHLGANSGKIARIKVKNARGIKDIIVQVETSVDKFMNDSFERITSAPSLKEKLKWLGKYDLIERQLRESKDIFQDFATSEASP